MPSPSPTDPGESFGELLRAHRVRAGLTQQDCALAAGLGVRTLRDLENSRARPRRATAALLATALRLDGTRTAQFLAAARRPAVDGRPEWPVHLPAPPALVGRDPELTELDAILRQAALVTLIGVAGVGKTGLAWNLAHRVAHRHPGGVAGIQVTAGATEAEVLAVVASVFGVARATELPARLTGGPALLLVDAVERNFEPVRSALIWLRANTTGLRLVVTGRRPTGIDGELAWSLAPLETPPEAARRWPRSRGTPPSSCSGSGCARSGTRRYGPSRQPTWRSWYAGWTGCRWHWSWPPRAAGYCGWVRSSIGTGSRVLDLHDAPASLRDAVASSYDLLYPAQQAALRALAQFRNRWSVRLAEPMLAGRPDEQPAEDIVALLDELVGLGLVSVRGTGEVRFRLLDMVRDFALERSAAQGELTAARIRHARLIADFATAAAPDLAGPTLVDAVGRLDDISGDVVGTLIAAAEDDPPTALRLAAALPRWWRFRGQDKEGRAWLQRLLDAPVAVGVGPVVRAWALVGVAMLAAEHGDGDGTVPGVEWALAAFTAGADVSGQLAAHTQLCALHQAYGRYALAREHGAAALELASRHGRTRDMVVAQTNLTWHEIRVADLPAARRRLVTVRRLATELGEPRLSALAQANLAEVTRLDGRYPEAVQLGRQAVTLLERIGDPRHRRRVLGIIALAQAQAGQVEPARATMAQLAADGTSALIEAYLALAGGDLPAAAEWFGAAEQDLTGQADVRDVVEALVGLVACTSSAARRRAARARLDELCTRSAVSLLPRECDWLERGPSASA